MVEIPRLNGIIKALAQGQPAFTTFTSGDVADAVALSTSNYDGVVFEMEHNAYNPDRLKDCFQYMLNRRQIVESGSLAPKVTPIVRIPPNGVEQNSWVAKQVLDLGSYGIVWPHVGSVEEARSAVSACRYPRPPGAPRFDPAGLRGDAPTTAARYWGLEQQEYYKKADVWPLDPNGEVLVVLMIEEMRAIEALPQILDEVPGIGVILIGEGDLSQELGVPRQYDHPVVRENLTRILETCKSRNIPCGHPHVTADNVERLLDEGFRFLMPSTGRSYAGLEKGRQLAGRVAV
jgi:4-hydroxy-2-oxoheptanedioate aldolase